MALMSEGQVFAWGKGEGGNLCPLDSCTYVCVLQSPSICWSMSPGALGLSSTENVCSPKMLTLPEGFSVSSIFCGPDSSALLSSSGQLLVCGSNRCVCVCVCVYVCRDVQYVCVCVHDTVTGGCYTQNSTTVKALFLLY